MQQAYIILGATGAVGSALVSKIKLKRDVVAIAVGRDDNLLATLVEPGVVETRQVDVTDYEKVHQLFAQLVTQYEVIGVAHCVGSITLKPASLITPDEWSSTLSINLTSAFNVVSAVAKHIKQNTSVVLFSSAAANIGLANHEAISAAKAGVEGLARAAAASYATKNIRFNVIAPGLSEAKMSSFLFKNERALDISKKMHGLGRVGQPEKLASLAYWLLDPENDWITGEVIHCDGGLSTLKLS